MGNKKIRFSFDLTVHEFMVDKIIKTLQENYWINKCKAEISHEVVEFPPDNLNFVEPDDDIYTIEEFRELVRTKCFIDYDGHGVLSDGKYKKSAGYITGHVMGVNELANNNDPKWTHVVWYNK